ncbi:MAG: hypothetical protein Q9M35_11040 [Rhodothermus sp.]|nr:hypothetical protein [Rhodothermus sp.]
MIALDLIAHRQIPDWLERYIRLGYALAGLDDHITIMVVPRIQYAAVALAAGMVSGIWERFIQEYHPSEESEVLFLWRGHLIPGRVECLLPEGRVCVRSLARKESYRNASINGLRMSAIAPFKSPGSVVRRLDNLPLDLKRHQNRKNLIRFLITSVDLCKIIGQINRLKYELENPVFPEKDTLCLNDIVRCRDVRDSFGMPGRVCLLRSLRATFQGSDQIRGTIVETDSRTDTAAFLQCQSRMLVLLIDRSHPEAAEVARNIDNLCAAMAPETDLPFSKQDIPPLTEIMVLRR